VLAFAAAGGFLHERWQRPRLTEKDAIVITDFTNSTGDAVFDETLRQGLAVQLEQSPFLRIVPEKQIQQTLRLMKRWDSTRLTPDIAREACQRADATVLMDGSIAQVGNRYSLILKAVNCSNGESLASAEAEANDKSHVLEALGKASSDIRKRLGESRATIQRFDAPLVQASTASLEALQVYSLGYKEAVAKGNSVAAIPLLQRALKIDPHFAMAYSTLGLTYWNVGETTLASENIKKAFDLRAGLTEEEKLRIEAEYSSLVTDNLEEARSAYEVWAQTYPRVWTPRNHLGVIHTVLGQHEEALPEYRAALRLYPESSLVRGNLIACLLALHRLEEARPLIAEANAKDPDSPGLRVDLYRLAFLQKDWKGMERQVSFSVGKPGLESQMLWYQAATAAYFGQIKKARSLFHAAEAAVDRTGAKEAEAGFEAYEAFTEALNGNETAARSRAESALRLSKGLDVEYRAGLALASAGDTVRARTLAGDLDKRSPEDTIVQFIYLPTLRAQIAMGHEDPSTVIELLQTTLPFELGDALYPAYLRGLAYLSSHRGNEAQTEFEKILSRPGVVLNSPFGALARLQLGRAFAMQGDFAKARSADNDFLVLWKDADGDTPVWTKAKLEIAKLGTGDISRPVVRK
jgi:tetratricopeptide (TPR) repeat protein